MQTLRPGNASSRAAMLTPSPKNVVVIDDDVADVNANAESTRGPAPHPAFCWTRRAGPRGRCAPRPRAGKHDQDAVAGGLDDASPDVRRCRIDKRFSNGLSRASVLLVDTMRRYTRRRLPPEPRQAPFHCSTFTVAPRVQPIRGQSKMSERPQARAFVRYGRRRTAGSMRGVQPYTDAASASRRPCYAHPAKNAAPAASMAATSGRSTKCFPRHDRATIWKRPRFYDAILARSMCRPGGSTAPDFWRTRPHFSVTTPINGEAACHANGAPSALLRVARAGRCVHAAGLAHAARPARTRRGSAKHRDQLYIAICATRRQQDLRVCTGCREAGRASSDRQKARFIGQK